MEEVGGNQGRVGKPYVGKSKQVSPSWEEQIRDLQWLAGRLKGAEHVFCFVSGPHLIKLKVITGLLLKGHSWQYTNDQVMSGIETQPLTCRTQLLVLGEIPNPNPQFFFFFYQESKDFPRHPAHQSATFISLHYMITPAEKLTREKQLWIGIISSNQWRLMHHQQFLQNAAWQPYYAHMCVFV